MTSAFVRPLPSQQRDPKRNNARFGFCGETSHTKRVIPGAATAGRASPRPQHMVMPYHIIVIFFYTVSSCFFTCLPYTDTPVQGAGDDELFLRDADHVRDGVAMLGPQIYPPGARRDVLDLSEPAGHHAQQKEQRSRNTTARTSRDEHQARSLVARRTGKIGEGLKTGKAR